MGQLIDGEWVEDDVTRTDASGRWTRTPSKVNARIRADGSTAYAPRAGRYHLWLAWNCTWSQRTLIVRNLLGMRAAFPATMAHWHRNDGGWWFRDGVDALQPDTPQPRETWDAERGFQPAEPELGLSLYRVYQAHDPQFTGRCTVPTLWDRETGTIVNNESSQILRMLELECGPLSTTGVSLLPDDLRDDIDATNEWVYDDINNGVYKVGFARSQGAYEEQLHKVFAALDRCEARLASHRYLCGDRLTEADVRLFPTLVRFDPVYYSHFKCSVRRIADYPNLSNYLRDLYQTPGFAETVDVQAYKLGYMGRSERLNPSRIIPPGPRLDWHAPHDRARFG